MEVELANSKLKRTFHSTLYILRQPCPGGLVLAALDVLGVVAVEGEDLLVTPNPVWLPPGGGRGRSP